MSMIYEEYHRIIQRLVAGDPDDGGEATGLPAEPLASDETRAAFIRVMKEALDLLDRSGHC